MTRATVLGEAREIVRHFGDTSLYALVFKNKDVKHLEDYEILNALNLHKFDGGPGRVFASKPNVRRGRHRTLIQQITGLDI